MLDFDHVSRRDVPSVAALVSPGAAAGMHKVFFGTSEIMLPVYGCVLGRRGAGPLPNPI